MTALLDPEPHLARLKDFQRATVDWVFKHMYEVPDPRLRFLVADEVGLGKTLVARGLVARAIRHLQESGTERIDVIYVCSNSAIAAQNVARLNVLPAPDGAGRRVTEFATRLTLLPLRLRSLRENAINFISFTPGTTFDLKSGGGIAEERALLWYALRDLDGLWNQGLSRLLRGAVTTGNWKWHTCRWDRAVEKPNEDLLAEFCRRLHGDGLLWGELEEVCEEFRGVTGDPPSPLNRRRFELVGKLRRLLATACLDALEPDLVILDEFQRFKHLLDVEKGGESAELAMALLDWRPQNGIPPRTLLLSATPYKMFTRHGEIDDDHHADFLTTMRFLLGDQGEVEELDRELRAYRRALQRFAERAPEANSELEVARDDLQKRLLRVMVRTERISDTSALDGMVEERPIEGEVEADDVAQAVALDRLRRVIGAPDIVEYWKSAPYLLSFMKGYELTRRLDEHAQGREGARPLPEALLHAVEGARNTLLPVTNVARHRPFVPRNGLLRRLLEEIEGEGAFALLWVPPSLAYLQPSGRYEGRDALTKSLIFSSWNVVPDAIAAVTSYEAERHMLGERAGTHDYSELTRKMRGLLRFAVSGEGTEQERFAGLGALLLGYPSPALAALGDPLAIALERRGPVSPEVARDLVAGRIRRALRAIPFEEEASSKTVDVRWYWVAIAALDARHAGTPDHLLPWLKGPDGWRALLRRRDASGEEDDRSGFERVLDRFAQAMVSAPPLRRRPADLEDVLATLALGGPAVCALRSLRRQAPGLPEAHKTLLSAAARVGEGFRSMFNVPESMALLRAGEDYWRQVAAYGVEGNLQAVLDEHFHTLRESLGLFDSSADDVASALGLELAEALSLVPSTLHASSLAVDRSRRWVIRNGNEIGIRARYGLRFADPRDEQGALQRVGLVRKAFNSPFRPFLLASTSVGQEGLDFHTWCHRVVHWNLPANPVDLEQREGRVHRYKGLAVRRNVARRFGLSSLTGTSPGDDPWTALFDLACRERQPGRSDLVPFWIYDEVDDPARIQRCVPMLPFSKEYGSYAELKKRLAIYRVAFGQPRQEDLVTWLSTTAGAEEELKALAEWQLNLSPLRRPS